MALFGQQEEGTLVRNDSAHVQQSSESVAQKKKEAAARFRERKAEREAKIFELANKLKQEVTQGGFFDRLSQGSKDFLLDLCKDPKEKPAKSNLTSGPSIYTQLFGESPKVGDSVTLDDVFKKTYKGKSTMDIIIKRWKDKGIVIEFEGNQENFGLSKYVIKSIAA